ncbi:MAG: hypothetical protein KDD50_13950, partial [Bdellovibrionales bacterium]|nr:hypothetical protein [Bdellovibrionales bacterium]
MKSIKLLTTLIMFAFSLSAQASNVDLAKSKVTWKGSKVIGSTHTGEVKIKSAQIKFKKGN